MMQAEMAKKQAELEEKLKKMQAEVRCFCCVSGAKVLCVFILGCGV